MMKLQTTSAVSLPLLPTLFGASRTSAWMLGERAFAAGVTPFLWGTALKTILVGVTVAGGAK